MSKLIMLIEDTALHRKLFTIWLQMDGHVVHVVADERMAHTEAVSVRPDLIIADIRLPHIDGKPYRTLKRHLSTNGLTPAEYRERYGLKADYPMVAPSYAASRSEMAKRIGLGRKPGQTVKKAVTDATDAVAAPVKAAGRKVRKTAAEAKQAATEHLG